MARATDRRVQPLEQLRAVGQAGEAVVPRLVGQPLLGAHAFADLRAQFAVGAGQFLGARFDPELEFRMRGLEVLLRALARQAAADVVGDEGQQLLVARR